MFVVLKCEICSLKSTFDCFHEYSRLMWVFLCITLWTSCISREIIIETLNFPKSKMRDTTGDQLSIIWFVLLCAKCSSVMFDIIGKLRFWINTILTLLTSLQIYRYTSYTSFSWPKHAGVKLETCWKNTYDRFHTAPAYWQMPIDCVNLSIKWKTTVYLRKWKMQPIKNIKVPDYAIFSWSCHFKLLISSKLLYFFLLNKKKRLKNIWIKNHKRNN